MKLYQFDEDTLNFKPINLKKYLFFPILFFVFLSFIFWSPEPQNQCIEYERDIMYYNEKDQFHHDSLLNLINSLNFNFPDIVYAQSILETGRFSSKIFLENNNLFGMKQARVRSTTALKTQYGHAYYNNWKSSVYDYALWYNKYMSRIKNKEEYFMFLSQYYAEDPNYVNKLKQIIDEISG